MKRRTLLAATAASGLAAMPFASMAQAYPSKPITVVVPFARPLAAKNRTMG